MKVEELGKVSPGSLPARTPLERAIGFISARPNEVSCRGEEHSVEELASPAFCERRAAGTVKTDCASN